MSITSPKERIANSPFRDYTYTPRDCQEKTLVSDNAIFENKNHFEIFPHCIVFKKRYKEPSTTPSNPKKRGRIAQFTKRARFRLFTLLAQIDNNLDFPPIFVSLTYHHGHENDPRSTKSQLHNFLVQIRLFDPGVQFIWRMEYQKRGAPHYHLIIFPGEISSQNKKDYYNIHLASIWHDIADPKSIKHKEYGCLIKTIGSYREACMYLSKYMTKVDEQFMPFLEGKHWGNSRNLPIKCKKIIGAWDEDAKFAILKIRGWLMANGKEKYADPEFINIHNDFVVFIDDHLTKEFFSEELVFRRP